jgi:SOS-response transcriptional repressor LexA
MAKSRPESIRIDPVIQKLGLSSPAEQPLCEEYDWTELDVEIGLLEATWWFDQLSGATDWPDLNASEGRPYNAYKDFANLGTDWYDAYDDRLRELSDTFGEDGDSEDDERWWLFSKIASAIKGLPSPEISFKDFLSATLTIRDTGRRRFERAADAWLIRADEVLTPPVEMTEIGPLQEERGKISHDYYQLARGALNQGDLRWLLLYLTECVGVVAGCFDKAAEHHELFGPVFAQLDWLDGEIKDQKTRQDAAHDEQFALNADLLDRKRQIDEQGVAALTSTRQTTVGRQLRAFRLQREMTLREVAIAVLKNTLKHGEMGVALGYLEGPDGQAEIKKLVNNISRLETGVRGLKSDVATNLASALNFDVRELENTPLGYHLTASQLIGIDLSYPPTKPKPTYEVRIAEINLDEANMPPEWASGEFAGTLLYLPVKTAGGFMPLSYADRVGLCRAGIQHHFPHNNRVLNETEKFPFDSGLDIGTQSDIKLKAEEMVGDIDWDSITERGECLHAVSVVMPDEDGRLVCHAGLATDAKWYRTGLEKTVYMGGSGDIHVEATAQAEVVQDEVGATAHPSHFPSSQNRATIPVLGSAQGGFDMVFLDNGDVSEHIETPPFLAEVPQAFAVVVSNESMSPRYEPGDYLYCHPNKTPRRSDYVVVALTDQRAVVKRFIRRTEDKLILEQLSPEKEFEIDAAEVVSVFVVVGTKTV